MNSKLLSLATASLKPASRASVVLDARPDADAHDLAATYPGALDCTESSGTPGVVVGGDLRHGDLLGLVDGCVNEDHLDTSLLGLF